MKPSASKMQSILLFLIFTLIYSFNTNAQTPEVKLLPAHTPDAMDHFIKNRKPLAKNQDVLLAKQFFKYLLGLPVEAWKCHQALVKKQTLPQLVQNKEIFEFFKLLRARNDNLDFNFDFENHGGDFGTVCDTKHGVCQGLTNLDRRMNMLAYYDPGNKMKTQVPPESQPEKRFKFYEKLVQQIRNDQPTIIPGFESLIHFSRDRIGRRVLLEAAVKTWSSENATMGGITQVLQSVHGSIDRGESIGLYKKIQARLSLNYNPILYLAAPKPKGNTYAMTWIHVMQAVKVTVESDKILITLKDPNMPIRAEIWEKDKPIGNFKDFPRWGVLEIYKKDAKIMYQGMQMSEVDFMPGDDIEISRFLVNTVKFCKKNPIFCVEGGTLN